MNRASDWKVPAPRTGLLGLWDRFVGPGATPAELCLTLVPAVLAALSVIVLSGAVELGWTPLQTAVAALLAFDLTGGVVGNATTSAKRWHHREGRTALHHLGFVGLHLPQVLLVSWLFRDLDIAYAIGVYLYLLAAAAAILCLPLRLQRSAALLAICGAVLVSAYAFSPTPGLEWFLPVLSIKLLVSHLTVEEPYL